MTVSEQIIQVIDTLCKKFGIAVDWTETNVLPYIETLCEKIITYEIATSIVWMAIMTLLSIASIIATKKLCPIFKRGLKSYNNEGWWLGTAFAILGLAILNSATIAVVSVQIIDIIKCVTIPEMYIFEYINALVSAA